MGELCALSQEQVLGHAWVTTTQRYTHLEVEDLQAQVAELPANGCPPTPSVTPVGDCHHERSEGPPGGDPSECSVRHGRSTTISG